MRSSINNAYQDLANAIILKAVDDYRNALNDEGYDQFSAEHVIKEVEKFFHSHYFEILTKVKGDYLIKKLKQEHEEKGRSNYESNIGTSNPQPD
jgi:hypothetical protein